MSGNGLGTPVEVRQRPRALLQTAADDDPVVEGVFPYEYVLRPGAEAHAGEWDVVVSEVEVVEEFEGLLVVGLGALSVTYACQWDPRSGTQDKTSWGGTKLYVISEEAGTPAQGLHVPDGLDPSVEKTRSL